MFSYLKEYFVCLSSTKSLRYSGDMSLIHLYVSVAMHLNLISCLTLILLHVVLCALHELNYNLKVLIVAIVI